MAKRFERHFRDQQKNFKRKNFKKTNYSNVGCFKCGNFGHIIHDCPKWYQDKLSKSKDKRAFKRTMVSTMWGDSDLEEDEESPNCDTCMTDIMYQGGNNMVEETRKRNNI